MRLSKSAAARAVQREAATPPASPAQSLPRALPRYVPSATPRPHPYFQPRVLPLSLPLAVPRGRAATAIFACVAGTLLLVLAALLMATPTLNLDDLGYAEQWPMTFGHPRFWEILKMTFLNSDIGVAELRTYGLARAIQILSITAFGTAPYATYAFMAVVHIASAGIVFLLVREIAGDRLTALFAAVAWAAAPTVLPLLKAEHHFLYSLAAFYPLLVWMVLSGGRARGLGGHAAGVLLLTAACLMGESAVIPMCGVAVLTAWARRDRTLVYQMIAALGLLAAYVLYQKIFINDPNRAQRIPFAGLHPTYLWAALVQLWENAKGALSYSHYSAEYAGRVGGVNAFKTPLTAAAFAVAALAAGYAARHAPRAGGHGNRRLLAPLAAMCLLSLALHAAVTMVSALPIAPRYTAAFFALLPVAVIAALGVLPRSQNAGLRWARGGGALLAAFALALSLGTLYRTELLINRPNRALIAALQPGTGLVARHIGWEAQSADGWVLGTYPGLMSTFQYEAANPFRSAWTSDLYLRVAKQVTFGTSCAVEPDGRIAVYHGREKRGVFAPERVHGGGLQGPHATAFAWQPVETLCVQ